MSSDPSIKLKSAKDSLVASLFELGKCASTTAANIIDFYNAIGEDEEEKIEAFTTLTESLQKLTSSTNSLHSITTDLLNPIDYEKDLLGSNSSSSATSAKANKSDANQSTTANAKPAKRKIERDPNAPKKPLTVFFAYSAYIRQELRQERERSGLAPLSSTEITQEISKKWKELSDSEKEKWKQAYHIELENYQREKQKYLEAKKNGTLPSSVVPPTHAPVGIPVSLQHTNGHSEKRSREDGSSSEKKKKKKKKDKKKDN
ncbi:hypothetical protein Kpol_1024p24 [Vanderwaltozyma polyspora DSM 70294]|uniref:HMG box domain-containing protein n=1 Tax=Vanderwaltozyma polyspora (strain ATCC 22028 / DSM 70294 / BCRC 21397 / CBS 2163 / NBRC 10782 / NRRL Y-8283 / UCD 57-17) TaxID=436907 RepID=A7TLI4_VANPO|nr:uncharacterized protein Kpol_1024p24 [Vanderwaltozyma polyspora DSM 70294]EDO16870.1 hypothetical protein Kpol_1024p24 [Vanderwaltozyma polyspora DSM 70294]